MDKGTPKNNVLLSYNNDRTINNLTVVIRTSYLTIFLCLSSRVSLCHIEMSHERSEWVISMWLRDSFLDDNQRKIVRSRVRMTNGEIVYVRSRVLIIFRLMTTWNRFIKLRGIAWWQEGLQIMTFYWGLSQVAPFVLQHEMTSVVMIKSRRASCCRVVRNKRASLLSCCPNSLSVF